MLRISYNIAGRDYGVLFAQIFLDGANNLAI